MSIEQDLSAEKVSHLDLTSFAQVPSGTPILEVLSIMRDQQLSAVLVTEPDRLVGIFTERDVLSRVADEPSTWKLPADDMMTASPQSVSPDAMVQEALQLMPVGSKWRLWLPADQGYPTGGPPNVVIVFEVELLEIVPAASN